MSNMSIEDRLQTSFIMQGMFPEFEPFAELALAFLGFKITPMQASIAKFMGQDEPRLFVGAPRGLGKSFLSACRADRKSVV